jgi:AP endonuclease-1
VRSQPYLRPPLAWRLKTERALCTLLDLANPKTNWNKTPGFTEAECGAFARILDRAAPHAVGPTPGPKKSSKSQSQSTTTADEEEKPAFASENRFVDVWRARHPDTRHYTYFSYRFNARVKTLGWRLDMCASLPLFG